MKLSIIASLAPVAFALVAATAFARVPAANYRNVERTETPSKLESPHAGIVNLAKCAGEASIVRLPEMTIIGQAPAARAWACGAVEANGVGGSQRTCEWR